MQIRHAVILTASDEHKKPLQLYKEEETKGNSGTKRLD